MPIDKETIYETLHLDGAKADRVLEQLKQLAHEGNLRRIIVKDAKGETLIEAPLTFGLVGAALAPVWAAIGAILAIVADCSITVEKRAETTKKDQPAGGGRPPGAHGAGGIPPAR